LTIVARLVDVFLDKKCVLVLSGHLKTMKDSTKEDSEAFKMCGVDLIAKQYDKVDE